MTCVSSPAAGGWFPHQNIAQSAGCPSYDFSELSLDNYVNRNYIPLSPRHQRDVSRSSRNVVRVAMDAAASGGLRAARRSAAAYGEIVWSWRRDRGVKRVVRPTPRRWQTTPLTGESTYKP